MPPYIRRATITLAIAIAASADIADACLQIRLFDAAITITLIDAAAFRRLIRHVFYAPLFFAPHAMSFATPISRR